MAENTKRPFSRWRTAWTFIRLGLLSLVSRDEVVSHAVDSMVNKDTDITVTEVPTLDELSAMIKAGMDMRAKIMCMQQQLSGHEQIAQSLEITRDEIENVLLRLRIMELIMEFSFNSDGILDKIIHEGEKEFVFLSLSRVRSEMTILSEFIAKFEYNENASSVEM